MKNVILILTLLIVGFGASAQGPKKGPKTPPKDTVTPAGIPYTDTLQTKVDTLQVKYYLDVDTAGYVSVNKGYLLKTLTFSPKVAQLKSETSVLFDEAWKRVDPNMVMNVREFRWRN